MRVIEYKGPSEDAFLSYVDIGWCESQVDFYCLHIPKSKFNDDGYDDWLSEFHKISLGVQMLSLNYYWRQFHESDGLTLVVRTDDYFIESYGEKINNIFRENYDLFFKFNVKWFWNHIIFKGLDFEGKEEEIDHCEDNEDGIMLKVFFNDDSAIRFLDDDDSICSLYVLESDYVQLLNEMSLIVNKF